MPTRILQFADVHFGAEDAAALAAIADIEEAVEPDLVLVCGDITQTGSTSEYKAARDWLARFAAPIVATPGNHDAPYYSPLERLFSPYARFDKYIRPLCEAHFTDARVAVQSVNSARAIQPRLDWSVGAMDLDELAEVTARFKADAPDRLHLLACHHPLVYPPESPLDKTTDNGPEALRLLSDAGCDAVLTGHIHVPFVKEREPGATGLLSIGAGTLSTRRRGVEPSFNLIEVDADALTVTAMDIVAGQLQRRAIWRESRDSLT